MKGCQSLSHTRGDCKYHVVFISKKRKKRILEVLPAPWREIFRELAKHKEAQIAALGGSRFIAPLRGSPNKPPALPEVI